MTVTLLPGDCLEQMATLAENSVDSIVTDPPYHFNSIVKRFGKSGAAPAQFGTDGAFSRTSRGFMGKEWDGGDIAFRPETWESALRVLKPGGHLLAFGSSKGFHRMAVAIEDAGFEIRDTIMWLYGTGFPKSLDVSKAIDKAAGAEREILSQGRPQARMIPGADQEGTGSWIKDNGRIFVPTETAPATAAAAQWEGWGTALKPAFEPIIMARKPLDGTVAANVLEWGVGAINIDDCRIPFAGDLDEAESKGKNQHGDFGTGPMTNAVYGKFTKDRENYDAPGRWPANVVHDGSREVLAAFPGGLDIPFRESFSRFFYCAKASKADRAGSKHPTVKPIALMRYLVRMVTPPGGTVLDIFAGSGSTGQAAREEGFNAMLIEREAEYQADIRRRLGLALPAPSFSEFMASQETPSFAEFMAKVA